MYTHRRQFHLVRALAPTRVAGVLVTLALLTGACSDINAPPRPSMEISPSVLASDFVVVANAAVTCTGGTITGDVGTFLATPTGSVTLTSCPVTGTVHVGNGVATQAFNNFLSTYAALAPKPADVSTTLTGTLAGVTLSPGVYRFNAAATLTGVLTLSGPSDGTWAFQIGTSGTGALTGTGFSVVMADGGQASNVTWWVADAATMTTSAFQGNILAGAGITMTGGTFNGNASSKADVTITGTAVTGSARVSVLPSALATITISPSAASLATGATQQFSAEGRDGNNNIVPLAVTWSVVNATAGTIDGSGVFTAGTTVGTYANAVSAASGTIASTMTVTVTAAPALATDFVVLARAAVTCTDGTITGDVGTYRPIPTGLVTQTSCPVAGTVHVGNRVARQAFNNFLSTYAALAPKPADVCTTLTGTLAGVTLSPGVYCFSAAATLTGVLTLSGPSDGTWAFQIGTSGTGALTGTSFSVVMADGGQASNVTWWVAEAATMTTSAFQGTILAGAGITLTGGTFNGNAWSKADVTTTGVTMNGNTLP